MKFLNKIFGDYPQKFSTYNFYEENPYDPIKDIKFFEEHVANYEKMKKGLTVREENERKHNMVSKIVKIS